MLRAILPAAAALLALTAPAAGAATLALEHVGTAVTEVGTPDGVVGPGDTIDLTETIRSSQAGTITGLSGLLAAQATGVSVLAGTRSFDDVAFGATTSNPTPFRASIGGTVECGQSLSFSLQLGSGADGVTLPLQLGTGSADAPRAYESGDVPHSIPNPGVLESAMTVAQSGRVKGVRVRIGRIDHPYVGDLRLTLVSPAGTHVVLVDRVGGSGDNFVNTTIGADGAPIAGGTPPFTGQFQAQGDLTRFDGEQQQGTWRLEVNDTSPADAGSLQSWGADVRPATCTAQPVAVVTAAPNPATVGQTVVFDASQSTDPTGVITGYEWDLDGNGSFETNTGSSSVATTSYPSRSTIPVGLRITNNLGVSDVETVTLSVTQSPVAAFTVDPVEPLTAQTATLDGSTSSDSDGSLVRWEWDLDGNGTFERDTQASPLVTASWPAPGVHTVRLRVTDDNGATTIVANDVTVLNRSPVAAIAAPAPVTTTGAATLDGSGSTDADGTIARYEWDLDGDGTYETDRGATPTVSQAFPTPGTPLVGLRVTDDQGAVATTSQSLVVTDAPVAALLATPNPARPGDVVSLSAAGSSDADGSIASYDWDLDGNGTFETATSLVAQTSRTLSAVGSYTMRVRVTDDAGATAVQAVVVEVVNELPVPQLSVSPVQPVVGELVGFSAAGSSDPDGSVASYAWDLDGNGTYETATGTTATASRSYPNPGAFLVGVRVTDNDGATAARSATVTVLAVTAPGVGTGGGGSGGGGGTTPTPSPTPPGTTTPGVTPPGSTAPGGGSSVKFTAWLTGRPIQTAKRVARSGVVLGCRAEQKAVCSIKLTITGAQAKRLKLVKGAKARKPYVLGTATVAVVPGQEAVIVVKPKSKARRALARAKRTQVAVAGTAVLATGESISLRRSVLVRR